MSQDQPTRLTREQHTALCAIMFDMAMDEAHRTVTRDLIRCGLVQETIVWSLTDAGRKALQTKENRRRKPIMPLTETTPGPLTVNTPSR
jgi:hypothetical protein